MKSSTPSLNSNNGKGGKSSLPTHKIEGPRLYINGFPKSGLHLLWSWILPFVVGKATETPWAGSFQGHSWTTKWVDTSVFFQLLEHLVAGGYLKGHTGYRPDIEAKLYEMDAVHVFIYRDLRDVAVSQAHHILNANVRQEHLGKKLYHPGADSIKEMAQGDFDYILAACIAGYGPWAGIVDRWQHYAGWLNVKWTLSLRFEDLIQRPREMASLLIRYVYGRTAAIAGYQLGLYEADLEQAIDDLLTSADRNRKNSATYRKGQVGGWREAFTPDHIDLWHKHDPDDWITKLGYSWDLESSTGEITPSLELSR